MYNLPVKQVFHPMSYFDIMSCSNMFLKTSFSRYCTCQTSLNKVNANLICFKYWTPEMVSHILKSAINLKSLKSKMTSLDILKDKTVTMIVEKSEPILELSISQGAHLLGAKATTIKDRIMFDQHYMGSIFSQLADLLVVSASTHSCVEKFANQACVPVLAIRSRVHQSLHALAAIMTIQEEYEYCSGLTMGYLGRPAPVLNSYLLLCPMLGMHLKFMCCCQEKPVHPILFKASCDLCQESRTKVLECRDKYDLLKDSHVIVSGPSKNPTVRPKNIFSLDVKEIDCLSNTWIYIHTCPKGPEISDALFNHPNARTLQTVSNMTYIAAALLASSLRNHLF